MPAVRIGDALDRSGLAQVGVTAAASITVREARPGDRGFIADLGRRTIVDSVASLRHFNEAMVRTSYDALLDFVYAEQHVALIAERDGVRAGFLLMLTSMPDEVTRMPQGFIAYMAVEPLFRRHGIGDRLLAAAEEEARRRGLPYMGLMVTEDNAAARTLYERSGFVTERRLLCKPL
jgi:ribosomal protein S18 acetylase RimI-like enzyme